MNFEEFVIAIKIAKEIKVRVRISEYEDEFIKVSKKEIKELLKRCKWLIKLNDIVAFMKNKTLYIG